MTTASTYSKLQGRPTVVVAELLPDPVSLRSTRHVTYRCPSCGHLERHRSWMPGTCAVCPGLVQLERA